MKRKGYRRTDLERRNPTRLPRERILVVCEGSKTEPNYFKELRRRLKLTSIEVEVVDSAKSGSAPISVVGRALECRAQTTYSPVKGEYDKVWCILDVEAPQPHASLDKAFIKARDNGVSLALSNPCFEFWYILHFKKTSRLFNSNADVIKELKKYYSNYRKNSADFLDVVYPRTKTAISNSSQVISEKHYGGDLRKCNPSTHVHLVVEHLQKVSRM